MTTNSTVSWTDPNASLAYTVSPGPVVTGYAPGTDVCRQFAIQIAAPANTWRLPR